MASGCYVGAIRWDAWYTNTPGSGVVNNGGEVLRSLSNSKYQYRAPFWATQVNAARLRFDPTQATMDEEIAYAAAGGLSFWAFLLYAHTGSPFEVAYNLYQASTTKGNMPWAMIRQAWDWGSTGNFTTQVNAALAQCQQAHYFKLPGNRPLVYLFYDPQYLTSQWGGSYANFKAALDAFRTACTNGGLGDPYIILMYFTDLAAIMTGLGCDGCTSYVGNRSNNVYNAAYTSMASINQTYWTSTLAAAGGDVVPVVNCGWDRQPRIERPVRWEVTTQTAYIGLKKGVYQAPTDAELIAHSQAAVDYVNNNPTICPLRVINMYAWNEFDEGGWLCPTLGDPTGSLLTAVAPTIVF